MRLYEAMFLMEPSLATDWPAAEAEIGRIVERAEGKVLGVSNWGDRKLAYPIGHRRRGLYALSYFEVPPDNIPGIERDVQLSEKAFRVLVVRREKMTHEDAEKQLAAEPPSKSLVRGEEPGARYPRMRSGGPDGPPDRGSAPGRGAPPAGDAEATKAGAAPDKDAPAKDAAAKDAAAKDAPAKDAAAKDAAAESAAPPADASSPDVSEGKAVEASTPPAGADDGTTGGAPAPEDVPPASDGESASAEPTDK